MEVKMGNFVLQLPVEITTDIFSRLPVGSVIRCKLVCKAWRYFVEDPVFLDIHTHRLLSKPPVAAAVTTNTEFYFLVRPLQENRQLKHHFGECNNHEMSSSSSRCCFKLSKPLNAKDDDDDPFSKKYYWKPIGSSNGLICSYGIDEVTIYVYNPCTRECVRLPPLMPITKQFNSLLFSGFGYNPLMNEYKVVLIRSISQLGAEVCVYTLGSGKWRTKKQLESWSLNVPSFKPGVFFNGALHWIIWKLINIDHYDIFSFDLANEEFRIIVPSPPLSPIVENRSYVQLGLWGGCCLCVRQWNLDTKTTDIWVLMNSKDKDIKSWTMKFSIPSAALDDEESKFRFYYPIVLLGSEKILLYTYEGNESFFVTYDSETGNFEDEVVDFSELQPSELKLSCCSAIPYTKSFVSLKPFGEEDAGLSF